MDVLASIKSCVRRRLKSERFVKVSIRLFAVATILFFFFLGLIISGSGTVNLDMMAEARLEDSLRRLPPNKSLYIDSYDLTCIKHEIENQLKRVGYEMQTPAFDEWNRLSTHYREGRNDILSIRDRYERSMVSVVIRRKDNMYHIFVVVAAAERRRQDDRDHEEEIPPQHLDAYRDQLVKKMRFELCKKQNNALAWFLKRGTQRILLFSPYSAVLRHQEMEPRLKRVDLSRFRPGEWICCGRAQRANLHSYCWLRLFEPVGDKLRMSIENINNPLFVGVVDKDGSYKEENLIQITPSTIEYDPELNEVSIKNAHE